MHERSDPTNFLRIAPSVQLGNNVGVHCFANLYGCRIGDDTRIGTFVEIQKNAVIGARCKISSHTFICEGVTIEDDCFVGHHVCFINDLFPLSPHIRLLTRILDKLERGAEPSAEPGSG